MSRKDVFGSVQPGRAAQALAVATPATTPTAGSVRRFSAAIDEMQERAARVDVLEQVLSEKEQAIEAARREGERVVEIDPSLIDPSPIRDRMAGDPAEDESLRASIAETGQQSPVLLRPAPSIAGQEARFVTVFGHRRVAVARALGTKVKAVVAEMSDEDAFVRQGVENAERCDLTFIEKALFARRLTEAGLKQRVVATSLGTAETNVSTMLRISRALPDDIVAAIGRGPDLGRRRWEDLVDKLAAAGTDADRRWRSALEAAAFHAGDGAVRIGLIVRALDAAPAPNVETITGRNGVVLATLRRLNDHKASLVVRSDRAASPRPDGEHFTGWLAARLGDLRDAWERGE